MFLFACVINIYRWLAFQRHHMAAQLSKLLTFDWRLESIRGQCLYFLIVYIHYIHFVLAKSSLIFIYFAIKKTILSINCKFEPSVILASAIFLSSVFIFEFRSKSDSRIT